LSKDAAFVAAVRGLYASLDRRIASHGAVCTNRGACCKFAKYDHSLFVTPVELAYFLAEAGTAIVSGDDACPYQQGGRCTVRRARPMGCRIFFCDVASQGWQPPETESTLGAIKGVHERFELAYAYVEWLAALDQLKNSQAADGDVSV